MYCGKCGAENNDSAAFCINCGASFNKEQMKSNRGGMDAKSSSKNRKVGIIVFIAAVTIILVFSLNLFSGRSYESTVKKYFDATMNADAKTIIELIPEAMVEERLKEEGYDKKELNLFLEEGEKELQEAMDTISDSFGEGWEMTYEIKETEDIKGKDLKEIKENYEYYNIEITKSKKVEAEVTIQAKDSEYSTTDSEYSTTDELYLIKVGRNWYLDVQNMESPI